MRHVPDPPTGLPKKTPAMHLFMFALTAAVMVWFDLRLFGLFSHAHSLMAVATLGLFFLCLNLFWLMGCYFVTTFLFSLPSYRHSTVSSKLPTNARVAVLYLTKNDFQHEAALSCVQLDYGEFHVFILDDSTEPGRMQEVDAFHARFPDKTTVVRRQTRQGFKAGSLNHALRSYAADFPYFAVVDSDGVLAPSFLATLMPYFAIDGSIAFVQGSHRPNPRQKSKFATDLAPGILSLWETYYPPRNRYGMVLFLGHGGIVRRDVWELVGGFPEMLSEDLAFSTKVRERGFQGWFVTDVYSYEDFPQTYSRFRRQQERYVKGACQYIKAGLLESFLKSKSPTWFEKFDLLLWGSTIFLPVLWLAFLVIFAVLVPLFFADPASLRLAPLELDLGSWRVFPLADDFWSLWSWDFYLASTAMLLAPSLALVRRFLRRPWQTVRLLFMSCVPYVSMTLVCVVWMVSYLATRRVEWQVTGEGDDQLTQRGEEEKGSAGVGNDAVGANRNVLALEVLVGVLLTMACLLTLNAGVLVFSLSLLLGTVLHKVRWESPGLAMVLSIPYVALALAVVGMGANIWGLGVSSYMSSPVTLLR